MPRALLACPVCRDALNADGRRFVCARGHSFDRAKEGHVHLLPAGHGQSRRVGDDGPMLRARRRFFDAGHYRPLSEAIVDVVAPFLPPGGVVADLGCGEGSHLAHLLRGRDDIVGIGVDLSKDAVRLAAKRSPEATWVVGDTVGGQCLADHVVDVATVIFAPRDRETLDRLLAVNGAVVVVIPLPDHLGEARAIYGGIGVHEEKQALLAEKLAPSFGIHEVRDLRFSLTLSGDDVADLLEMTPHRHHLDDEVLHSARRRSETLEVTAAVQVLSFLRTRAA